MNNENKNKPADDIHVKLAEVLKAVGTNANQISKELDLDRPDKFYKLLKGAAKPSFSTISEIINLYPQVNANYFFKDDVPILESSIKGSRHTNDLLELEIRHLKERISLLEKQHQELLDELKSRDQHKQEE